MCLFDIDNINAMNWRLKPTILKRTYYRDGTADTDMYFDANGNPKALSKGQYGIKRSGKVSLLLDKNGNIMLCVDNLLNGLPCMVVVFGCVVCLLMIVLPKSLSVVLTIVYVSFILYETLMFRESEDAQIGAEIVATWYETSTM